VPAGAREIQIVDSAQIRYAFFPCRAEPLVSAIQVAEMRLAAFARNDLGVDDRGLPGDALP